MPCSSNCNVILILCNSCSSFAEDLRSAMVSARTKHWRLVKTSCFFGVTPCHTEPGPQFQTKSYKTCWEPWMWPAPHPLFHQKLAVEILENGMLIVGFNYHMTWSWFLLDSSKLAIHGGRDRTSQDADGQYPFAHARDLIHRLDGWATWVGNVLNFKGTYIRTYRFFRCFRCVFFSWFNPNVSWINHHFSPGINKPSVSHSLDWDFHFQVTCVKPLQLQ